MGGGGTTLKGHQSSRNSSSPPSTCNPTLEFQVLWSDSLITLGGPQREKEPYTIVFNHGLYYSMINYYYLEWIILNNYFPKHKACKAEHSVVIRPAHHIRPFTYIGWAFSLRTRLSQSAGFRVQCLQWCIILQRKSKLTYGWKELRFYTLQTNPTLHQARKLIQFPKASEAPREWRGDLNPT